MLYVYVGCLTFGIIYSLVSALLGSHGFDGDGADHSGLDIHCDGIDHGGLDIHCDGVDHGGFDIHIDGVEHGCLDVHNDAGVDSDVDTPSPFSPVVIASAITAFGAMGLIGKIGFKMSDFVSALVSLGIAGAVGAAIFFGIVKVMYNSQSNSTYSQNDVIGFDAEVITPIPSSGLGEIVYVINGVRYNLAAKSADSEGIGRGEIVKIRNILSNVAIVVPKMTLEDYDRMREEFE